MIRAAVLGLTDAGLAHAFAYSANAHADLVGVYDADPGRADEASHTLGVPAFPDVAGLLTAAHPSLVTVRLPAEARPAAIRAALDAGCHVVASLPVAADADTTRSLLRLAAERGLVLAGDFHLRFVPTMDRARRWIAEGILGSPLFLNVNLWNGAPDATDPYDLFRNLGAHGIDLMRQLCGEPIRVQCFATRAPGRRGWSSAQVNVTFRAGTVGTLTLSHDLTTRHPMARIEFAGTKARIVLDNVYEEATLLVHAEEEKRVVTNSIFGGVPQLRDTYARRIDRLVDQIGSGTAPTEVDGGTRDVRAAHATMEAAIEAIESESVVDVAAD